MRVLVAGIGNIFLSDDGFGVEVVNRMTGVEVPEGVQVADYGIRGLHLAYELLEGYDGLVLVDALPMGEPAGTVAIFEPQIDPPDELDGDDDGDGYEFGEAPIMDAHAMNPAVVLGMLTSMGGQVGRVLVVGCEPSMIEEGIGLSEPVAAAVEAGVAAVLDALTELRIPNEERSRA